MTLLAGLGVSAAGALVVFGALTGRLAAIVAAVDKPSDLAASGSYTNGIPDSGHNAATATGSYAETIRALLQQSISLGVTNAPGFDAVRQQAIDAMKSGDANKEAAAIQALRNFNTQHNPANTGKTGGGTPHGA